MAASSPVVMTRPDVSVVSLFKQHCYPLKKIFYREHPRVEERSWEEIDKFLNLHQIKFSGFDVPKPIFHMDEINFPDFIINELRMQGVSRPTAIQSMTWPSLYSGRDIMCIGMPTNSRVVSYICPALVFIRAQERELRRNKKGPLALIVTQTKEVAKDIVTHAQMLIQQAQCTYCCLFDDELISTQSSQLLERDYDIVIGNYHRLCELLDLNVLYLKDVAFLVMDDFYRNRSARLSDEIKRVVNETRSDRQTAIYSRIVPSGLQKSNGDEFQNDAIFVCVGNDDIHVIHNKDMPQQIHVCTMAEKKKRLQDIITDIIEKEKNNFKILVYANGFKKIRITEKIVKELGIDTFAYERTSVGKRRRAMKEKVYYNFNATPNSVLIASDVVSSKVELPDLKYIINADFPLNLSLYLNRMRMSNIKSYISIFIAEDARHADRLIYVLNECHQRVPPILYKISEAYTNSGKDVDRMPSLQEISDGLTKPVEKPIPKPLPPTVALDNANVVSTNDNSNASGGLKRTLDNHIKTEQPSPSEQATTSNIMESTVVATTNQPSLVSPASSITSSNSSTSLVSPVANATTAAVATSSQHHQNRTMSGSSLSSSSQQSKRFRPSSSSSSSYHQQRPYYPQNYNRFQPPSPALVASVTSATNNMYGSYGNQTQSFYYPPPAPAMIPSHVRNMIATTASFQQQQQQLIYNTPPHLRAALLAQQQQQQIYRNMLPNIQQHYLSPPPLSHSASTSQLNLLQPPPQHQVKMEPVEQPAPHRLPPSVSLPYFTNPIPFKIEPTETATAATRSTNSGNNTGMNILNQLMQNEQLMSQLEKVKQTLNRQSST